MDSFELNKVLAAVLLALLAGMIATKISDVLVSPHYLAQDVIPIEVTDAPAGGGASTEEAKIEPIEPLLAAASVENGKDIAKKCLQCHTLEKGGANKIGPNLWNSVGAKVAHVEGYAYSSAFKAHGGDWSYENLGAYLYKPQQYVPGTKMSFAGVKKTKDRADLVAYLRTLSDAPHPLP